MELELETFEKAFDSTILFSIIREMRLPHWHSFSDLASFMLVTTNIVIKLIVVRKFKH